jgi:hypothetical protein
MYVEPEGELYSFCPGKALWDPSLGELFRLLVIATETGVMLTEGGIEDQPSWWIDLLGWFVPRYDQQKFAIRTRMILGDGKGNKSDPISKLKGSQPVLKGVTHGGNNR